MSIESTIKELQALSMKGTLEANGIKIEKENLTQVYFKLKPTDKNYIIASFVNEDTIKVNFNGIFNSNEFNKFCEFIKSIDLHKSKE